MVALPAFNTETVNSWFSVGIGAAVNFTSTYVDQGFETDDEPFNIINGYAVIYVKNSANGGHSSRSYIQLGGYVSNSGTFVTSTPWIMPATVSAATVSFWLKITTTETGSVANDFLYVNLRSSTTGALVAQLASFSNLSSPKNSWVQYHYYNLQAYQSSNVTVSFEVSNSATLVTTFLLDDVLFNHAQA